MFLVSSAGVEFPYAEKRFATRSSDKMTGKMPTRRDRIAGMEAALQEKSGPRPSYSRTKLASAPTRILHCSYLTNEFECRLNATSLLDNQREITCSRTYDCGRLNDWLDGAEEGADRDRRRRNPSSARRARCQHCDALGRTNIQDLARQRSKLAHPDSDIRVGRIRAAKLRLKLRRR